MQKSQIQSKLAYLSSSYKTLKSCQTPQSKLQSSDELIKLCTQLQTILQKQQPSSKNFRHLAQITNIKNTALSVREECLVILANNGKKKNKYDISSNQIKVYTPSSIAQQQLTQKQKQISKKICIKIIEHQLKSAHQKIDPEQLEQLAQKMQKNNQINLQIKSIIIEQRDNLDIIQDNVQKAMESTENSNKNLQDAAQVQLVTRLTKIKLGLVGILAGIGYGMLGLPGMIVAGVVGLYKAIF